MIVQKKVLVFGSVQKYFFLVSMHAILEKYSSLLMGVPACLKGKKERKRQKSGELHMKKLNGVCNFLYKTLIEKLAELFLSLQLLVSP